jgi:hypothetical protein
MNVNQWGVAIVKTHEDEILFIGASCLLQLDTFSTDIMIKVGNIAGAAGTMRHHWQAPGD